jgi:ferredoxin
VRVAVDRERCQGHARCYQICPEVFQLDDEGHALSPSEPVPVGLEPKVVEAERNCPERAISVQ